MFTPFISNEVRNEYAEILNNVKKIRTAIMYESVPK